MDRRILVTRLIYQSKVRHNLNLIKGGLVANRRHGFGIYKWKDGTIYEGEYVNDLREGDADEISAYPVTYSQGKDSIEVADSSTWEVGARTKWMAR